MSALSDLQEERYREIIRGMIARAPNTTAKTIQYTLAHVPPPQEPIELDVRYVSDLLGKIKRERKNRQWGTVTCRLAEVEDLTRAVQRELWSLAEFGKRGAKPNPGASVAALAHIGKLEHDLFQAQFDSGVFVRQIGTTKYGVDDALLQQLTAYVTAGLRATFAGGRAPALRAPDQLVAGVSPDQE